MNKEQFKQIWTGFEYWPRYRLVDFVKFPTERNSCYMTGYFAAMRDHQHLDPDVYSYLLALIGGIENHETVRDMIKEVWEEIP